MKKRILSLALSAAMLLGSINFAVAEEVPVQDSQDNSVVEVADDVASDASVDVAEAPADDVDQADADGEGLTHYPVTTAGNWMASVSGDAGGQEKITSCVLKGLSIFAPNSVFDTITLFKDASGAEVPAYEITATGEDSVHMRAGTVDSATNAAVESAGKVASTSEGMAYYYQKISTDDDFIMKAKAKINAVDNTNNQVGFGAVVVDDLAVDTHYPTATRLLDENNSPIFSETPAYANTIVAGRLRLNAAGKASGGMMKGWYRINNELYGTDTARSAFLDNSLAANAAKSTVMPGDEYDITLRKSGSMYTLTVNDEQTVIDASAGHGEAGLPITFSGDDVCVGVAATRAIDIDWSDLSLQVTKPVKSIEIASIPTKTDYYVTEPFDATGLSLEATYSDDTKEIITDTNEFTVSGFEDTANNAFNTAGEKTLTISMGAAEPKTIKVNVRPIKITKQEIKYAPAETDFFVGTKFDPYGLTVRYYLENGKTEDLNAFSNKITINGIEMKANDVITHEMVGNPAKVVLEYPDNPSYDKNGQSSTYDITVNEGELQNISLGVYPTKMIYFINDVADFSGMTVQACYQYDGKKYFRYLDEDEYTVSELKTDKAVDVYPITVTYIKDPSKTISFNVSIKVPTPVRAEFLTNPRYTYSVGERFDPTGTDIQALYTSGAYVALDGKGFYLYDGINYYDADYNEVSKADAEAADFYFDISKFDTTTAGKTTTATVVYNKARYLFQDTELTCTVVESKDYIWKAALLGSSSVGVKDVGTSEIYATINGTEYKSDKNQFGIEPQAMINGKLPQVESVRLNSWDGCGKVSGDQDGIAYYYTRVSNKNNFKVSADITVNRYIREVDNLSADDQKLYDKYYAEAMADEGNESYQNDVLSKRIALDRLRSGQECFGIMAKDVIQFAGGVDESGQYTGSLNTHMTTDPEAAMQTDFTYTNGDNKTVTVKTPVDLFEAYTRKLTVSDYKLDEKGEIIKDENGNPIPRTTYAVTYEDVNNIFASNMVVAAACTDSTWPTDKTSSSYYKKTQMNRFNIMIRRGVAATDGGGERVGILSTTDKLPEAGEKYNVTLEKIKGGYMITTYDYQTGKTVTKKDFEEDLDTENILGAQDNDNIYVGFFASRWADCTVSNISMYETDPNTDPQYTSGEEEAVSPKITINSPLYVTSTDYTLSLKSSNKSGGYCTISQNGKTIYSDVGVGRKLSSRNIKLVPDSINKFTIVYYPSTADLLTSYDPVTYTFSVTHASIEDSKTIYVAGDGKVSGDGTRENPLDLESALGLVDVNGTIVMLDGTYHVQNIDAAKIAIPSTYSGIPGKPKTLKADEGATPVVDLEGLYSGFEVDASYWIFDGITVINSAGNQKTFIVGGSNNVIKNCTFHDNQDCGFQLSRINSSNKTIESWPSYNLVQSCEAYNNCDPSKNNADGFAAKLTVGYGNVFEDCISHHNLDDGWDCYTKLSTGPIGASVLENCISYRQGFKLLEDGSEVDYEGTSGGNGFKLGGENINVIHYIKDCKTFENKSAGVDSNSNPAMKVRNVILYNNIENNFYLYSGTSRELVDARGLKYDLQERPYKFDYDIKGAVSIGKAADLIGSFNAQTVDENNNTVYIDDTVYGNVNVNPIVSESNYLKKYLDTEETTYTQVNSNGESIDPNTFFLSTNKNDSLTNGRYSRNADGSFNHGPFLERAVPYVHDAADEVTLPDNGGNNNPVGPTDPTSSTESTSSAASRPSGGGGGGGGGSTPKTATTTQGTTVEATTNDQTTAPAVKPVISKDVIVTIGQNVVKIGDQEIAVDAAPYIQSASNSTLVPLRVVSLAIMGGDVANADSSEAIKWDNTTKTATILAGNKVIQFTAGSDTMVVDQKTMLMENGVKAELSNGRMYVPFRALGKALGVEVAWNGDTREAKYIAPTEATTEATTAEATTVDETAETTTVDAAEATTTEENTVEDTTAEDTTVEVTTVA